MKYFLSILITLSIISGVRAQDKILFTIDTMPVYASEFKYMYLKNNNSNDSLPVKDYLPLFINYKLKVYQALQEGYDKDSAFKAEYERYLLAAAKPYFQSKAEEQRLIRQMYDRMKYEVRFSFLSKKLPPNYTPKDTARIYNLLDSLRQLANSGTPFKDLVFEYTDSEKSKANGGDVGFVTVFSVPPELTDFLWNARTGEVSRPLRYRDVYYLLKVTDKRPYSGERHIAQIYIPLPKHPNKQDSIKAYRLAAKIDSALKAGESFEQLAKQYSSDFRSASRGGDIGWIKAGQTEKHFEQAAFSLEKTGDVTMVRTPMGLHFIKLLGKKQLGSLDQEKPLIEKMLKSTGMDRKIEQVVIDSLKKVYGYKMTGSLDKFYQSAGPDFTKGKWNDSLLIHDTTPLFVLNGHTYTNADFAKYIKSNLRPAFNTSKTAYINRLYNQYVTRTVKTTYVKQLAAGQDPEFAQLAKEFYDGLLLFNISNDKVWKKALQDTTGLKKYYEKHKADFDTILAVSIVSGNEKSLKKLAKYLRKNKIQKLDTAVLNRYGDTSLRFVKTVIVTPTSKDNKNLYLQCKQAKQYCITTDNGQTQLVYKNDKFDYIRGLIAAAYQDYLEKQWIKELRSKHKITINQQVLSDIESSIKNSGK